MSYGIIGDCGGCCSCDEAVGFKIPGSRGLYSFPTPLTVSGDEGTSLTLTIARNPSCFSYNGTPAEYQTAFGVPPPVADGGYFYNLAGAGSFWLNTGGVFSPVSAPSFYGDGPASISWTLVRNECGCPHMLGGSGGTISWAAGDVSDKTIVVGITCPGPPRYWGCAPDLCGGEAGRVDLVRVSGRICLASEPSAYLAGICTHPERVPGSCRGYTHVTREWVGTATKFTGFAGFLGGSTFYTSWHAENPVGTAFEDHLEVFPENGEVKLLKNNGQWLLDLVVGFPDGVIDDTHWQKTFGPDTYRVTLGGPFAPVTTADANLAIALAASPARGAGSGSYEPNTWRFTWAGAYIPGKDPAKFYTIVSSAYGAITPYPPGSDWVEVANPGYFRQNEALTAPPVLADPALGPEAGTIEPGDGLVVASRYTETGPAEPTPPLPDYIGQLRTFSETLTQSTVDARESLKSPIPKRVEMQLITSEDDVVVSTGAWVDISGTLVTVPAPAGFGGAHQGKFVTANFRITNALPGDGFACHPGL